MSKVSQIAKKLSGARKRTFEDYVQRFVTLYRRGLTMRVANDSN